MDESQEERIPERQRRGRRHRSTQETVEARRREVLRYLIRGFGTAQIHALLKGRYPNLTYRAAERDVAACSEKLRASAVHLDVNQEIASMLALYNELIYEAWKVYQTAEEPMAKATILARIGALTKGRLDLLFRTGMVTKLPPVEAATAMTWEERVRELRACRGLGTDK